MTKEELIVSAATLGPFALETAREYDAKHERLAAELNRIMGGRQDLDALVGAGNREMMEQNHRNHALFISTLLMAYSPAVLVETVLWVFRAYLAHGFSPTYWAAQLDAWLQVLAREMSPASAAQLLPLYRWILVHIPQFSDLSREASASGQQPEPSV